MLLDSIVSTILGGAVAGGNAGSHLAYLLLELGAVVLCLALLARVASRLRFPTIPLYLVAGLLIGSVKLLPLSEQFVTVGADIGVLLLLFMLGLEYSWDELLASLRQSLGAGLLDIVLNFFPGMAAGWLLGWSPLQSVLLGGVTYISSSGIASRILSEFRRMKDPESRSIVSILVFEDLAMAAFLPVVAMSIGGHSLGKEFVWVFLAFGLLGAVLFAAARNGRAISNFFCHESDEVILLTTFGAMLLVAGVAQHFQISAGVGAFLLGIGLSGPIVAHTHRVMGPLRDLFAATFFFFSGLSVEPSALWPVMRVVLVLALVTALTKLLTGWWACRNAGLSSREGIRAGATLIARGEFSLIIAGLAADAGAPHGLAALATAYVLVMGVSGPVISRIVDGSRKQSPPSS